MTETKSFKNHFLIAMPHLEDPHFFHAVTFICEHNSKGALGFIINQPLGITVAEVLDQMNIQSNNLQLSSQEVLAGGPVQIEQGFVLHQDSQEWQSSLDLESEIKITASRDILAAIANNEGPEESLVVLGYAGWEAGQLEAEIADNYWLVCPAEPDILFHFPINQRWEAAARLLGVDIEKLSSESGHA